MRYVIAGYVVILSVLFLYAVQLVWRRHRLEGAVARVAGAGHDGAGHDGSGHDGSGHDRTSTGSSAVESPAGRAS